MKKNLEIETERAILVILPAEDASLMLTFYHQNDKHLAPWEAERSKDFFTLNKWIKTTHNNQQLYQAGTDLKFSALNKSRTEILGTCNFSNIVHGVFQACHLGYSIAEKHQGQGLMSEIVHAGIQYMFNNIGLHRIMANYVPANNRSEKLLTRLGFEQEGLAKSYLKINGQWQDHILTSKINLNKQST